MTIVKNTHSVKIDVPAEAAFEYVADLKRHPEWSGGRLHIEAVSSGAIGIGSQFHSKGDVAGQKDRPNQLRVTEYQPPHRFAFIASDPDFGNVLHEFTFTPGAGGTAVERTVTVTMPALQALMFRLVVHPLIASPMMNRAMRTLKTRLESGSV